MAFCAFVASTVALFGDVDWYIGYITALSEACLRGSEQYIASRTSVVRSSQYNVTNCVLCDKSIPVMFPLLSLQYKPVRAL